MSEPQRVTTPRALRFYLCLLSSSASDTDDSDESEGSHHEKYPLEGQYKDEEDRDRSSPSVFLRSKWQTDVRSILQASRHDRSRPRGYLG